MRTATRHPRLLAIAFAAMWVVVAFHGAHAVLGFGGAGMASFCKNWVYTVAEVIASAICVARVWTRREDRWAWGLIAFGLVTWTAGDLVWTLWLNNVANPPLSVDRRRALPGHVSLDVRGSDAAHARRTAAVGTPSSGWMAGSWPWPWPRWAPS